MQSRTMSAVMISSMLVLVITVGLAWTLNVDAEHPFARSYEVGPYMMESGQSMDVDIGAIVVQESGLEDVLEIEFDTSTLPTWVTLYGSGTDWTMTLSPSASVHVDCVITAVVTAEFDRIGVHTIGFTVDAVSSDENHDSYILFDSAGGIADCNRITYTAGGAVALPNCSSTGQIFQGWYLGEEKVGNAGDLITPVNGQIVTAEYVEDPDYVAPGTYDWSITLAMVAGIFAVFALCCKYGGGYQ